MSSHHRKPRVLRGHRGILQTLFKSAKVIPVMLMGKVLNGKSYSWVEYGEALAITSGVAIFGLSKDSSSSTKGEGPPHRTIPPARPPLLPAPAWPSFTHPLLEPSAAATASIVTVLFLGEGWWWW